MEIGSYIELDLRNTGEYFSGDKNIARLNTGRSGIYHATRLLNCSMVYLPYYLCPTIKEFLLKKDMKVKQYSISNDFEPLIQQIEKKAAIVIVNYFGILSESKLADIAKRFLNVIIDNCPAFFNPVIHDCFNVYSARKFFGVPDGCYVIGTDAHLGISDYKQDSSSETSAFLLKRIEMGSSAVYSERMRNEKRLDKSDIMLMSILTQRLLNSIDYKSIKSKRLDNFKYAHTLFGPINSFDPTKYIDSNCVPMVYPLVVKDPDMVKKLQENKIYTGRWWNQVLTQVQATSFEAFLSQYMIPVPIDQRYGKEELEYCHTVICKM